MVDIKNIFKRAGCSNKTEKVSIKRLEIAPSSRGLYIDTDGVTVTPHADIVDKKDFKWVQGSYYAVVPGLIEWYERYLQYLSNPTAEFDWQGWHRDGLLFTKQIYFSLPRCIEMRYIIPAEDNSDTLESFDVTEEKLDSLLDILEDIPEQRDPVTSDIVGAGVKEEDGYIVVRLRTKGKYDSITFQLENDSLELLREFLEKIALTEYETIPCESLQSEYCSNRRYPNIFMKHGMYFYPQTIGGMKNMGHLHIYSERGLVFSAYVNSVHLVRSLYRPIISHLGSMNDNTTYKSFQSSVLECYIDNDRRNHISGFRKNHLLGNFIRPAIENIRKYFDSLLDENEYA